MHVDLEKLMVLQGFDIEAKRLREEIIALPKLISNLEATAKATVGQRAVVLNLLAAEDTLRRRQESDIKDKQQKIARVRKQLDVATTTVQVTAFEHEIAFAQAEITKLEDAELASMERGEQLDEQKRVADQVVESAASKYETERERALGTMAAAKTTLTNIDAKRATQRTSVGESALATYDRIARAKGTGVAAAINQKCSACQMMVRPQRWNDLRNRDNDEMMTCESCGRLLWYDPSRDSPQRKVLEVESIAAQIVRGL